MPVGAVRPLIANSVTESEIRRWLSAHGYFGQSAKLAEVELHAIQRPGWLQVFRFHGEIKSRDGHWQALFGVVRDDQRRGRPDIRIFPTHDQQQALLREWSDGLITHRRSK